MLSLAPLPYLINSLITYFLFFETMPWSLQCFKQMVKIMFRPLSTASAKREAAMGRTHIGLSVKIRFHNPHDYFHQSYHCINKRIEQPMHECSQVQRDIARLLRTDRVQRCELWRLGCSFDRASLM